MNQFFRAGRVPSRRTTQSFSEGRVDDIGSVGQTKVFLSTPGTIKGEGPSIMWEQRGGQQKKKRGPQKTPARRSEKTRCVTFVDEDHGFVMVCQLSNSF